MVRRQKEKQYLSAREQRENSQTRSSLLSSSSSASGGAGGAGASAAASSSSRHGGGRRLPFSHCALSLTPYTNPVCTRAGIIFDNAAVLPFVLKHGRDPVTGKAMTSRDLITLNMDRNDDDDDDAGGGAAAWQCPVLHKTLTDHMKIVAIVQPKQQEQDDSYRANVYSYQAYYELNVKPKNYEDLMTGLKFRKCDVIVLNDPDNDAFNRRRDISTFYHVRNAAEFHGNSGDSAQTVKHSVTATRILEQIQDEKKKKQQQETQAANSAVVKKKRSRADGDEDEDNNDTSKKKKKFKVLSSDVTGVSYTTGQSSTSFTSTAVTVSYDCQQREATAEEVLESQFHLMRKRKKKGLVRLVCSQGRSFAVELHCDIAPRTCTNFLRLCRSGQYDGTTFHRLIPNFMIQGGGRNTTIKSSSKGDSSNSNSNNSNHDDDEDCSIWGGDFVDEFDDRLKHTGCGVLSMANAGPNTNRRQFFLTFKSCHHLDRKHTVFGRIVQGLDAFKKMETVPTDKNNRPRTEIKIISTDILMDPAQEAEEMEYRRLQEIARAREDDTANASKRGLRSDDHSSSSTKNTPSSKRGDDSSLGNGSTGKKIPSSSSRPEVGRYLKQGTTTKKMKTAAAAADSRNSKGVQGGFVSITAAAKQDDSAVTATTTATAAAAALPSRLPPPPKKTTFRDFSGW